MTLIKSCACRDKNEFPVLLLLSFARSSCSRGSRKGQLVWVLTDLVCGLTKSGSWKRLE